MATSGSGRRELCRLAGAWPSALPRPPTRASRPILVARLPRKSSGAACWFSSTEELTSRSSSATRRGASPKVSTRQDSARRDKRKRAADEPPAKDPPTAKKLGGDGPVPGPHEDPNRRERALNRWASTRRRAADGVPPERDPDTIPGSDPRAPRVAMGATQP